MPRSFFGAAIIATLLTWPGAEQARAQSQSAKREDTRHILFVGDSFTHGRYLPVRLFNNSPADGGIGSTSASRHVVDENFGINVPPEREESKSEFGPWGGIPGIFAELAFEAGLAYDVHIEAISATTLAENYRVSREVIERPIWDTVVLQEASFEPIPSSLSQNPSSDPQAFCNAVQSIEEGVHASAPKADVYLYTTWAPADTAYRDTTANGAPFSEARYLASLATLTSAYDRAYASAAARDGRIRDIAPVGNAWALAWAERIANPDPYSGSDPGVSLSFNYQPGSEPVTLDTPTDAGYHHPSIFGAYLSGLVLFQTITKTDVRELGPREQAAAKLGIPASIAVQLQHVAWEAVRERNPPHTPALVPAPQTGCRP